MKTQHTPGPWAVQYMTETFRIVGSGDDIGGGHQVAVLYHDPDHRVAERNPNARADALLIAAAPELLAALNNLQANPNDPRAHRQAFDAIALVQTTTNK